MNHGTLVMFDRLVADEDAPHAARMLVAEFLAALAGAGDDRCDDLTLVASEMVTNAVLHGPPGVIDFRLTATDQTVRVEVGDGGLEAFDPPPSIGPAGNWGLRLVDRCSDRFGIERRPWTLVWCEFDVARS
jgi:anti-sigma regulatory factor (Ser/Thr protein kinase)